MNIKNICPHTLSSLQIPLAPGADMDGEEFANAYVNAYFDLSGSMEPHEEVLWDTLNATLTGMEKSNESNPDIQFRVKLMTFHNDVKVFNDTYLEPRQLASAITRRDMKCGGGTNLTALISHMDGSFSRTSPVIQALRKHDPKPVNLIITDFAGTDSEEDRRSALAVLSSNRLFMDYSRTLVVYVGSESNKAGAVTLAGGNEDNVIALDRDLSVLLAPVLINSTIALTDGTHMGGSGSDQTAAQLAHQAEERAMAGEVSAAELNQEDLRDELLRLMGKVC